MIWLVKLRADRAGIAIMEFALLAPAFLLMLVGLIESGRIYWMKQTLDEVAYSTVRCMSVGTSCETDAQRKAYAVQRATGDGIHVTSAQVTATPNTRCRDEHESNFNFVSVSSSVRSPLSGFIPLVPSTLTATACFPVAT